MTHDKAKQTKEDAKQVGWGSLWLTVSILLHVAAVAALVYVAVFREWFFKPDDPQETLQAMSDTRVRQMVRTLLASQTKRLEKKVAELKKAYTDIRKVRDAQYERYARSVRKGPAEPKSALGLDRPTADLSLSGKDFQSLYDVARAINDLGHEMYRQTRALEMARLLETPLSEANQSTQIPVAKHPQLSAKVFKEVALIDNLADGRMKRLREEVIKAHGEVDKMIGSLSSMREMAQGFVRDSLIAGLFGADDERYAELSASTRWDPHQGYSATIEGYTHEWGVGVGPVTHRDEVYPREAEIELGDQLPIPGQKIMAFGRKAEWMFVDSWYIIGPFDNPNRQNIDKKFPPETAVDLNAVYYGKPHPRTGKPVRLQWQWVQSSRIPIIPPVRGRLLEYAIFYAYTRVYSHTEQERLCLFGSDDFGKCWVNGKVVYGSGKTPHPWIPHRGRSPVRFHRGLNEVLFKVENAWGRIGFSMCIYVGEKK